MTSVLTRLRRRRSPRSGARRRTSVRAARAARAARGDAGASLIELVGLTPLVVMLTFGTVQVALWMYEKQLVTAAAQEAAHAAAAADLSPAQARSLAEQAATRFISGSGSGSGSSSGSGSGSNTVTVQTITVERSGDAAEASITATGLSMIPGLDLQVTGVARSSIEQFIGQP